MPIVSQRIVIAGIGLIGGSFALALRRAGFDGQITGVGRDEKALRRAVERGICNDYSRSIAEVAGDADLVMHAVPMGAMDDLLAQLAGSVAEHTVITDAGSVKQSFIDAAGRHFTNLQHIVPAHPIAGTEHSGVEAGFDSLFDNRRVIVTPLATSSAAAVTEVAELWRATGASVEQMAPRRHDDVFAAISHLPHVAAFSLVETLHRIDQEEEVLRFAAGGFSDFTRIASSDPVMWRDICLHNRSAVLDVLGQYRACLDELHQAIDNADSASIEQMFSRAKSARDAYLQAASDSIQESK